MSTDEQQLELIVQDSINLEYLQKTKPNFPDFDQLLNFHASKITDRHLVTLPHNMLYKIVCLWLCENKLHEWAEAYLEAKVMAKTITHYYNVKSRPKKTKKGKDYVEEEEMNPDFSERSKDYVDRLMMVKGKLKDSDIYDLSLQFSQVDNKVNPNLFINKIDELI